MPTVRDPRIDRLIAYVGGVGLTVALALAGWFLSSLRDDVRSCSEANAKVTARLSVVEAVLVRIEKRLDGDPRK